MQLTPEQKAKVDRLGQLEQAELARKPEADELKLLQAEVQSWFTAEPADKPVTADGNKYRVQLSPRAKQRKVIDWWAMVRCLGLATFFEVAKVALDVIDKRIPKELHGKFLIEERTGPRKLTTVAVVVSIDEGRAAVSGKRKTAA